MRYPHGFTLLEMLVVLLLVGIVTTFAVLATGDGGRERQLVQEAERISALLVLAGEEAVLQSREYGIHFSATSYSFMVFEPSEKSRWRSLEQDALLRPRSMPAPISLELYIDDLPVPLDGRLDVPQVLLTSGGERTAFELRLFSEQLMWRVVSGMDGRPSLIAGGAS